MYSDKTEEVNTRLGGRATTNNTSVVAVKSVCADDMRERIKTAVFKKAVNFKAEIKKEMDNVRIELDRALKEIKTSSNLMLQEDEVKEAALIDGDFERVATIDHWQREQSANVQRILTEVAGYEKKFADLKAQWEDFRTNFKGKVIQVIKCELEQHKHKAKPEDILDWCYFMPEIIGSGLSYGISGNTRVRVQYFE